MLTFFNNNDIIKLLIVNLMLTISAERLWLYKSISELCKQNA